MQSLSGCVGRGGLNDADDVRVVQSLLNRQVARLGLRPIVIDGIVGPATFKAIEAFQRQVVKQPIPAGRIEPGSVTLIALVAAVDEPKKPDFPPLVDNEARAKIFGKFEYVADPQPNNPEHIKIQGDWVAKNIVTVSVDMGPNVGMKKIQFHKLASGQLEKLFTAWKSAGLLDRILSYAGSFVPRFVRGSTTKLSNHAIGSAFDINAAWNGLGKPPAAAGAKGCVWELVPIAHKHGFYWGGHFSRPDGMHFEVAKIM